MSKNTPVTELVFGIHAIVELLKAKKRKLYTIYTTKPTPKAWSKITALLPSYTSVQYVDRQRLSKMAESDDHQGVIGLASPFTTRVKSFEPQKQRCLLVLDGIQDARNLGAILRSAYCTGMDGVILTQKNSAPITAAVLKSSAGLAQHLDIQLASSLPQTLQSLKTAGYHIYLATVDNSKSITQVDYQFPLCIVIGNEAVGISSNILNYGQHISIPQKQADISYNASVAAGIIMFQVASKCNLIG